MIKKFDSNKARAKRHARVRAKISGTPDCPRLNVYRSTKHIYAQIIQSGSSNVVASASTCEKGVVEGVTGNSESAAKIGSLIAARALAAGVDKVAFDRSGFKYHGRVKALAEAARAGGLEF